jgi:hypothetical protein
MATIEKMFAPVTVPSLCGLLLWTARIISVYCAYVLAFRKPGAVVVARRGLVFITVLQLSLIVVVLLLARPGLRDISFGVVAGVVAARLIWLAVWYTYLVRSKRVQETYVV